MDRQKIVETAYEGGLRLNHLKAKYGLISRNMAEARKQRIETALKLLQLIDDILSKGDYASQQEELSRLKAQVDEVNMSPASEKRELELPVGLLGFKPLRSLWVWLTGR